MASSLKAVPSGIEMMGDSVRRPAHMEANCSVSDGRPLPAETLATPGVGTFISRARKITAAVRSDGS